MGEGEDPEEENLAEEASVKSTVSISRWTLITYRTTRYLKHFDSTRSSSLSLVSSFSVYTRENSIENLNHNENRPSQSCPTSPTKIALSFDSPLLNKVDFEKSFRLFVKLMAAQEMQFCKATFKKIMMKFIRNRPNYPFALSLSFTRSIFLDFTDYVDVLVDVPFKFWNKCQHPTTGSAVSIFGKI